MRRVVAIGLLLAAVGCGGGAARLGDDGGTVEDLGGSAVDLASSDLVSPTPTGAPVAMPLINRGVPVYASQDDVFHDPALACDESQGTSWSTNAMPAWIAWDLSTVPTQRRQRALLVWNAPHAGGFFLGMLESYHAVPVDYTVEINAAPGGGSPPMTGWQAVATVKANTLGTGEHLVELGGAAWARLAISKGTGDGVAIDVDLYSAPNGASDAWLFMGDSITYMTMTYAFSDLAARVNQLDGTRWPAVIDAAIGGTNTTTALPVIDETIAASPSRFVVLAYGTNDHPQDFVMEALVQKVLAAGRVPVVPHMPWASGRVDEGTAINTKIDELYAKYPQIVRGPDLWALTYQRTEYIPTDDVHPTDVGRNAFRQAWAETIAAQP